MSENKILPAPPVYTGGSSTGGGQPAINTTQAQDALLRALADGITDPKELAKLASLKKTADVYTVLDKLSLRKEFHAALARAEMSLDFIVARLKKVCENPNDEVALKGVNTVLKTIGLDRSDDESVTGKAWEDTVLAAAVEMTEVDAGKYEVTVPSMPGELRKMKEDSVTSGKRLYEE